MAERNTNDTPKENAPKLQIAIHIVTYSLVFWSILALVTLHVEWWLFDIYASFIPQIFIVLTALLISMFALYARFIIREGWHACASWLIPVNGTRFIAGFISYLVLVAFSVQIHIPIKRIDVASNLKVATHNVLYTNQTVNKTADYLAGRQVDLAAFQEIKPNQLEQARQTLNFDYSTVTDCGCSAEDTEIGIVSRYPLTNTQAIIENQNGGVLRAEVQLDATTRIAVYGVHIPPPFSSNWYELRNGILDRLAEEVIKDTLPVIVMGDFNATFYPPALRSFASSIDDKARNVAQTRYPKCSWFGFSALTCSRIDHIYIDTSIGLVDTSIGDPGGSDHHPVIAELAI